MISMKKSNMLAILIIATILLLQTSCFQSQPESPLPTETASTQISLQEEATNTSQPTTMATTTVTPTATRTPRPTQTLTPTMEPIMVPDWILEPQTELYLCIAKDESGELHLAIANPVSQETFFFPFSEADMRGYFWLPEPAWGVGWIDRKLDRYAVLEFSTKTVEFYPIADAALELLDIIYSDAVSSPLYYKEYAYPVKMIDAADDFSFFIRSDIDFLGIDYSKHLSPDQRYYAIDVTPKEEEDSQITQIRLYDFEEQQERFVEVTGIPAEYHSVVSWSPINNDYVDIGDYIVDITDGSVIYQLPENRGVSTWHSNGELFFYNPSTFGLWYHGYSDDGSGAEIFIFNLTNGTTRKMDAIDDHFQYHEPFSLKNEVIFNLEYIPSRDVLGFSYDGLGTAEGWEMWSAGGYCLYSLQTEEVDCFTDAIEELYIVLDEEANYTARETVVSSQWSPSDRFITFYLRVVDDLPHVMIYDLDTASYFFIENDYSEEPLLGIWSP